MKLIAEKFKVAVFCLADSIKVQKKCGGYSQGAEGYCKNQEEDKSGGYSCRHVDRLRAELVAPEEV